MPLYSHEKVYRSLVYFFSQLAPIGVQVVDGASYGVRLDDPSGKSPSIAVNIDEFGDFPIELGSESTQFNATVTINAMSRFQRDALKSIVYSGLVSHEVPVYNSFEDFVPASGAEVERYLAVADYLRIRDMLNFETDREKFFWVAVCFVTLEALGL